MTMTFLWNFGDGVTDITITNEKVNGDVATLNGSFSYTQNGSALKGTGTITMKNEDGVWKIDLEKWNFQ